jgi:Gamma-glutamyltranspeptidase
MLATIRTQCDPFSCGKKGERGTPSPKRRTNPFSVSSPPTFNPEPASLSWGSRILPIIGNDLCRNGRSCARTPFLNSVDLFLRRRLIRILFLFAENVEDLVYRVWLLLCVRLLGLIGIRVMGNTGIIFNCRGDYYSLVRGEANALEPGKRPRSTLQSTLVTKDGQPFMVTGSPGGDDQVMITIQTLVNVIDFGMNIQQAIEAPRWYTHTFPASPFPHSMVPGDMSVEARIPETTQRELIARGHKLHVAPPWSMASSAGIMIDGKTGVLSAGADPRVV